MPIGAGVGLAVGAIGVAGATTAVAAGSAVAIKTVLGAAALAIGLFSGLSLTVGTGMSVGGQLGSFVGHAIVDSITFCVLNSSSAPLIF